MKVIFDSSFLMAVAEHPTTWFEDITEKLGKFDPVIMDCVASELDKIAKGEGRKARYARVALEMTRSFQRWKCGNGKPDDEIVSASHGPGRAVATLDSKLLATLKATNVRTVSLRAGRVTPN